MEKKKEMLKKGEELWCKSKVAQNEKQKHEIAERFKTQIKRVFLSKIIT